MALLQAFDVEMQSFFYLFTRYLAKKAQNEELYVLGLRCAELQAHPVQ